MSILKNLKKNEKKRNSTVLKAGIVLLLDKQEQFNKLALLFEIEEDSISIDGVYVAYMDEYPSLQVEPISNFAEDIDHALEAFEHKNLKPLDFNAWFRRLK